MAPQIPRFKNLFEGKIAGTSTITGVQTTSSLRISAGVP